MSYRKALLSKEGEALSQISSSFLPQPLPVSVRQDCCRLHDLDAPNWFAVYTTTRHEKRIAPYCAERQIESFLPLFQEVRQWKNRCKVKLDLPLFPSYIFVRIVREERFRVLNVPGVLSILGAGNDLLPVQDEYIASLRQGLDAHKIEPHPVVEVGDRVRIVAGAMCGMEGILIRKKNELRVVLKVAMLDRSIAVEVTMADIAFVSSGAPCLLAAQA